MRSPPATGPPPAAAAAAEMDVRVESRDEAVDRSAAAFPLSAAALMSLLDFTETPPEEVKRTLARLGGVPGLCAMLRVDPDHGLSDAEVADIDNPRRRKYGVNQLPPLLLPTLLEHAIAAFKDVTLIALLVAAAISLCTGLYQDYSADHDPREPRIHWIEGFAIFLAVFIIVVVTAVNNWKKDDLLRRQAAEADDVRISVRRNGDSTDIPVHEIHVGDVVLLKDGDIIPVDGLVIDSHNGKCDESSATGESDHIKKKPFDAAAEEAADAAVKARRFPVDVTADVVDGPIDFQRSERPKGQSSSTPFLVQSGTKVNEGTITIVALCVGSNSRYGLLLKEVKKEVEDTPMQKALARLAASIGWFGLGIAFAQLVILTIKFIVRGVQNDWRTGFSLSAGPISSSEKAPVSEFVNAIVNIVIQAVTIVVVAVPEGLPMAVTIALIYGTRKMAQRNNFVRQLAACETMGGATTICTDKTGTLTENKMTVVAGFVADRAFDRSSIASLSTGLADPHSALPDFPSTKARTLFRSSVVRNSKAFVTQDENGSLCFRGDKTEGALLGLCCPDLSNVDLKSERVPVEKVFPFSSKKKSMATVARADGCAVDGEKYHLYVKGAAEVVLANCTSFLDSDGRVVPFGSSDDDLPKKKEIYHLLDYYAKQCLRCIVTAYCPLAEKEFAAMHAEWTAAADAGGEAEVTYESRLTFIGLVGIEDPLRAGVDEAVRKIQNAGVVVRMVTGDNIVTATSIAMKAGILANGGICMEGPDFRKMYEEHEDFHARLSAREIGYGDGEDRKFHLGSPPQQQQQQRRPLSAAAAAGPARREGFATVMKNGADADDDDDDQAASSSVRQHIASGQLSSFDRMLPKLRVLARSSPKDKQILVEHLKSLGETVAVTGDGANDGPALKAADVGFAMGITGSGIAKEAASIILLDDNFVSVVTALVWGRSVSESVRKFLMFQLTVNVTAVLLALVSSIIDSSSESVLTAVQLLWVNLLMDSLGALALATDEPDEAEFLSRPPINSKKEPLINWNMKSMILCQAAVLFSACMTLLYGGPSFFAHLMALPSAQPARSEALRAAIRTAVFNTFVLFNIANEINCRRTDRTYNVFRGILRNRLFASIVAGTLVVQFCIVQFGSHAFKTEGGLNPAQWAMCVAIGCFAFPVGLAVRVLLFRPTPRARPVKLDVYPTINPSWKRELLWRRAFSHALRQSASGGRPADAKDVVTIQLSATLYNSLKSAMSDCAVLDGPDISGPSAPTGSSSSLHHRRTVSDAAEPRPLARKPTVSAFASAVVAASKARRAGDEAK